MYLEISPRRAGKTTRAIAKAREFIYNGIEPTIIGLQIEAYPKDLYPYFTRHLKIYNKYTLIDEFEFINNLAEKMTEYLDDEADLDNWHIYGTPRYIMSPILKYLLSQQSRYIQYRDYRFEVDMYKDLKDNFKNELTGEFVDND